MSKGPSPFTEKGKGEAIISEERKEDRGEQKESFLASDHPGKKNPRARKKRKQEGEGENVERWLVSYADFITLLFAFFVTMYAISKVDQQKLIVVTQSLQRALRSLPSEKMVKNALPASLILNPSPLKSDASEENPERKYFESLASEIQKEVRKKSDSGSLVQYIIQKGEMTIRVPDFLFFDSGQAAVREEVLPILDAMGKVLEKIPNSISVEGHTDAVPIRTSLFKSNWELSTLRATSIVRYLMTRFNFDPYRLSAEGFAEFRPISINETEEGRMKNRRVDLVILSGERG